MLLNSLILLLLSNSITSRRDKSILYSRATITILLISAFIAYDSLSLLFLAKGIGIFGGLFHTTATTNFFHMFIFLITSVILLLTSFYPRKVWLKEYSSPNRLFAFSIISKIVCLIITYLFYFSEYLSLTQSPSPHLFDSHLYASGFSGDKGKGKAVDSDEQITDKNTTDEPYSDESDSEYQRAIARAKNESLGLFKKGESSSQGFKLQEEKDTNMDISTLKLLKDEALKKAKEHNKFKMQFDKENVPDDIKEDILKPMKQEYDYIQVSINKIKNRLYDKGIDPDLYTEQPSYSSSEGSYSDTDEYSSVEEEKQIKRVKFSDNNEGKPFFILPITLNFKYIFSPGFNVFFLVFAGLTLYMIDISFIPNFIIAFNINLTKLITLYLFIHLLRLIYKYYNTAFKLYYSYLNKDYLVIYSNICFTTILVITYFSPNIDTGIFYC